MMSTTGLVLLFAAACPASTFITNSFSDAFVTTGPGGSSSGKNFGTAGVLGVSAPGKPQGEFQSVMEFDLSAALNLFNSQFGAGQWSIQSATLQLHAAPPNNAIFNAVSAGQFGVSWMQNNAWTEGTGTPASPGATGITFTSLQSTFINPVADENLGTFSFNGATNGVGSYSLALAPGFASSLLSGGDASLRLFAADSSVSYLFNSRNFANSANWPQLSITAVPEPGSLALITAGLVMLAGGQCFIRRSEK